MATPHRNASSSVSFRALVMHHLNQTTNVESSSPVFPSNHSNGNMTNSTNYESKDNTRMDLGVFLLVMILASLTALACILYTNATAFKDEEDDKTIEAARSSSSSLTCASIHITDSGADKLKHVKGPTVSEDEHNCVKLDMEDMYIMQIMASA